MTLPQPKDAMRGFMALLLLCAFMVGLFWVITQEVPEGNKQLVTYMLGQLSVLAGIPVAYYFATSKSSSDKNDLLERVGMTPQLEASRPDPGADPAGDWTAGDDLPKPDFHHYDERGKP